MGALSLARLFSTKATPEETGAELGKARQALTAAEEAFADGSGKWTDVEAARRAFDQADVVHRAATQVADRQAQAEATRQRQADEERLAALLVSTRHDVVAEALRSTLDRIADAALLIHGELVPAVTDAASAQARDARELRALATRLGADVAVPPEMHLGTAIGLVQRHLAHRLGDQRMRFDIARWLSPAGDVASSLAPKGS